MKFLISSIFILVLLKIKQVELCKSGSSITPTSPTKPIKTTSIQDTTTQKNVGKETFSTEKPLQKITAISDLLEEVNRSNIKEPSDVSVTITTTTTVSTSTASSTITTSKSIITTPSSTISSVTRMTISSSTVTTSTSNSARNLLIVNRNFGEKSKLSFKTRIHQTKSISPSDISTSRIFVTDSIIPSSISNATTSVTQSIHPTTTFATKSGSSTVASTSNTFAIESTTFSSRNLLRKSNTSTLTSNSRRFLPKSSTSSSTSVLTSTSSSASTTDRGTSLESQHLTNPILVSSTTTTTTTMKTTTTTTTTNTTDTTTSTSTSKKLISDLFVVVAPVFIRQSIPNIPKQRTVISTTPTITTQITTTTRTTTTTTITMITTTTTNTAITTTTTTTITTIITTKVTTASKTATAIITTTTTTITTTTTAIITATTTTITTTSTTKISTVSITTTVIKTMTTTINITSTTTPTTTTTITATTSTKTTTTITSTTTTTERSTSTTTTTKRNTSTTTTIKKTTSITTTTNRTTSTKTTIKRTTSFTTITTKRTTSTTTTTKRTTSTTVTRPTITSTTFSTTPSPSKTTPTFNPATSPSNFLQVFKAVEQPLCTPTAAPASDYCLTKECILASARLIQNMDEMANPCNNFYQFACGGFSNKTSLLDGQSSLNSFISLGYKLLGNLKDVFESPGEKSEPKVYGAVRNLYRSCMDTEDIARYSRADLLEILTSLGGWPVVEGRRWSGQVYQWSELAIRAEKMGFSSDQILGFYISTDEKDGMRRVMTLDEPSLGLAREHLVKGVYETHVRAYYAFMVDIAVYLGAERQRAMQEMRDVLDFELIIANNMMENHDAMEARYYPVTVEDVQKIYPYIDWVRHINRIFETRTGYDGVRVNSHDIVNIANIEYLKNLNNLSIPAFRGIQSNYIITPRVQANYIIWGLVQQVVKTMTYSALNIRQKFIKAVYGKSTHTPRWKFCVRVTAGLQNYNRLYHMEGSLANAVGAMYVQKYFPPKAKAMAEEMVENIIKEFLFMLDENDWMDADTKTEAMEKVYLMRGHIAYPEEILNMKVMDDFFTGLHFFEKGFLQNLLVLNKHMMAKSVLDLWKPVERYGWKKHGGPAISNAYYIYEDNGLTIPAGILDGAFFNAGLPLYMNYGAIGMIIGHEIIHAFDKRGIQYDGHGNLYNWWRTGAIRNLEHRKQCVVDQFNNYTVQIFGQIINVDGFKTLAENVADLGGIKGTYRAYIERVKENGLEPLLPGMDYDQSQLFWISAAQPWCNVIQPGALHNQILTNSHAPDYFRVNGPLSNMEDFSRDWGCPLGSPMNPVNKCEVW